MTKKWLFSYTRAASVLGIGKPRLLRLIEDGKIGVVLIDTKPMIAVSELKRFIAENSVVVVPAHTPRKKEQTPAAPPMFFTCNICKKMSWYDEGQIDRVPVCKACKRLKKNAELVKQIRHNTPYISKVVS